MSKKQEAEIFELRALVFNLADALDEHAEGVAAHHCWKCDLVNKARDALPRAQKFTLEQPQ